MHLLQQLVGHDHRAGASPKLRLSSFPVRVDGDFGVLPTPGEELRSPVRVSRFALQ